MPRTCGIQQIDDLILCRSPGGDFHRQSGLHCMSDVRSDNTRAGAGKFMLKGHSTDVEREDPEDNCSGESLPLRYATSTTDNRTSLPVFRNSGRIHRAGKSVSSAKRQGRDLCAVLA